MPNNIPLDCHFDFAKLEYERMLTSVGIQEDWHVLDAGCGFGSFLPLMSKLVGKNGRIDAIDLSAEKVEWTNSTYLNNLDCRFTAQTGDLLSLPFEDNTFDAIWNSAVVHYLDDHQLDTLLDEFCRVTKPGGFIAIKESLVHLRQFQPCPPMLMAELIRKSLEDDNDHYVRLLRNETIPIWLRRAGLQQIWSKVSIIERAFPLTTEELSFMNGPIMEKYVLPALKNFSWPTSYRQAWIRLRSGALFKHHDYYYREGHILAVGQNPQ